MLDRTIRFLELVCIALGLGLIAYGVYSFWGPDIAFALRQHGSLPPTRITNPVRTATATATQPSLGTAQGAGSNLATPTPKPVTYPVARGQGNPAARLIIPRIKLDIPVKQATWTTNKASGLLYTDWNLPYDAAGQLQGMANPGEAGKVVLSGHNNLVGPNQFGVGLFAGLWDLQAGDLVYVVDTAGNAFAYRVTESFPLKEEGEPQAVRAQHAKQVLADNGAAQMTLLTCWNGSIAPLSGNTYRWIVNAQFLGTVNPDNLPHFGQ